MIWHSRLTASQGQEMAPYGSGMSQVWWALGQVQGEPRAWEREEKNPNKDSGVWEETTWRRWNNSVTFLLFSLPVFTYSPCTCSKSTQLERKQCVHSNAREPNKKSSRRRAVLSPSPRNQPLFVWGTRNSRTGCLLVEPKCWLGAKISFMKQRSIM